MLGRMTISLTFERIKLVTIKSAHTVHSRRVGLLVSVVAALALLVAVLPSASQAQTPVGTGFSYQGQLVRDGAPVSDTCSFTATLFDAATGGAQVGSSQTLNAIPVTGSLFTLNLDFGTNVFTGPARYLELGVRCSDDTATNTLAGRARIDAVPYAQFAESAVSAQTAQSAVSAVSAQSAQTAAFAQEVDPAFTDARYWRQGGNAASNPAVLGTTNPFSLTFVVSNTTALRLFPNATAPSLIGGALTNQLTPANLSGVVIAGGAGHTASSSYATISGGENNTASSFASTVSGGSNNTASSAQSTVSGGLGNTASGYVSVVGGGINNTTSSAWSTLGGGQNNQNSSTNGTISGGANNTAGGGTGATVGGGSNNTASAADSTVTGGYQNTASGTAGTVGGGSNNTASGPYTTISGGSTNSASGQYSIVGGGNANSASADYATVAGGQENTANSMGATVAGGQNNQATSFAAFVGGGENNQAASSRSVIAGGQNNQATSFATFVGGGQNNQAAGVLSVIAGGENNQTGIYASSVGGGNGNTASGPLSTIPGGENNRASEPYSFAAGRRAQAVHQGAFVWADATNADFASTADNQFRARATGGVTFITAADGSAGVSLPAGGGAWATVSDRNAKTAFVPVDPQAILEQVSALPISTWQYRTEAGEIRHMGPMAQDFAAAFGLGANDVSISTVDADGVALAAIQGLHAQNQVQAAQISALTAQNAALEARLAALEQRMGGNAPASSLPILPLVLIALLVGVGLVWRTRGGL
jgi:hypothetical protein